MLGFISKATHDARIAALAEEHAAEIKTLSDARDHLVRSLNDRETEIRALRDIVESKNNRIKRIEIDNRALEAERDQHAAEVERMRPIVEKAERRRALAMLNLQQNKGRGK